MWLNDNRIGSPEGMEAAVAGSREILSTIYLERNPCVSFFFLLLDYIRLHCKYCASLFMDFII